MTETAALAAYVVEIRRAIAVAYEVCFILRLRVNLKLINYRLINLAAFYMLGFYSSKTDYNI